MRGRPQGRPFHFAIRRDISAACRPGAAASTPSGAPNSDDASLLANETRNALVEAGINAVHLIGAGLLWWASTLQDFGAFYPALIAYALCYMPTLALVSAMVEWISDNNFISSSDIPEYFSSCRISIRRSNNIAMNSSFQ